MLAADSKEISAPRGENPPGDLVIGWKQLIEPINPFLAEVSRRLGQEVEAFDSDLTPYAEYALNGGRGKHLRPALVALAAKAVGEPNQDHVTAAVIIEMVHLATLVHDDIMDEAEIRRGRLTMAANWGNDIAVLFGDCLFARALTLAADFPTPEVCRAVATATNTVCTGEIIQTRERGTFKLTRQRYFKVLEMKTGELFALSCELSGFLSGVDAVQRQALREFGLAFGTAYQVYDDCVDLFGSESLAGKSLGTDLAKGKLTLPVLAAYERAGEKDRARLEQLVGNWHTGSMKSLTELLSRHDALGLSLECMNTYLARAGKALRALPASEGRASLFALTEFFARQTDTLGSSSADSSL